MLTRLGFAGEGWFPRPDEQNTSGAVPFGPDELKSISDEFTEFLEDEPNRDRWGIPGHSWALFTKVTAPPFLLPSTSTQRFKHFVSLLCDSFLAKSTQALPTG